MIRTPRRPTVTTASASCEGKPALPPPDESVELANGNKRTASLAVELLLQHGYVEPTAVQRTNLLVCFAESDRVLYGRAFDVVKCPPDVDLNNRASIKPHIGQITVAEIKSTNRRTIGPDFDGYFFDLTNAELLVAQSLGAQFLFVFVNIVTLAIKEMTLQDIFRKARKTYPKMAVLF